MTQMISRITNISCASPRAAAVLAGALLLGTGAVQAANLTWVGPTDGSGDMTDAANWNTTGLAAVDEPAGDGDFLFFGYRTDEDAFTTLALEVTEENSLDLGFGGWRIGFRGDFDLEVFGGGTISSDQTQVGRWDSPRDSNGTLTITGPDTTWIGTGFQQIGLGGNNATDSSVATGVVNLNGGATYNHSGSGSLRLGTDQGRAGAYEGTININGVGNTLSVANPDAVVELGLGDTGGSGGSGLGTVNLNGGLVDLSGDVILGSGNGGTGVLNLGNGTDASLFRARSVLGGTGNSTVNFNGVTYEPAAAEADLISGLDTANITEAGLDIDLRGMSAFLSQQNFTGEGVLRVLNNNEEPGSASVYFSGSYPGGEIAVEERVAFQPLNNDSLSFGQLTVASRATFGPILGELFVEQMQLADDFDPASVDGWDPEGGEFGDGDPDGGGTSLDLAWEVGVPVAAPESPNGGNVYAAKLDGFSESEWTESWLRSPVLDLRELHNATFSFQEYLSLDPLGVSGNPNEDHGHWHWAEVNVLDADNGGALLEQLVLRHGEDTEWSLREFELSEASLGRRVIIEFALFVDHLGAAEGWFVDDVSLSTFGPVHGVGAYTVGSAAINGNWAVEYDSDAIDRLNVEGALDITGATIAFHGEGTATANALILASYGSVSGTFFDVQNVPTGYTLDTAYQGNKIALISDNAPPASAYDTWAGTHGLDPATDGAPDADANGDGIKNLAKFAMGQSPVAFGEAPAASLQGEFLELAYTRDSGVSAEVEMVAQAASDLTGTWSTADVEDTLVETIEGIEHRVARVPADGSRRFLRLEINEL